VTQVFKTLESLSTYRKSVEYLEDEVLVEPKYAKVRGMCGNKDGLCSYWASLGECESNQSFMRSHCALACRTCEYLDISSRCPIDESSNAIKESDDLEHFFERISDASEGSEYEKFKPSIISKSPWIVTFDSFLSDEECDRLIELGEDFGYSRSRNLGKVYADGTFEQDVDDSRTSINTWCSDSCAKDPLAKQVMERIANVTGIKEGNQEDLQLLKYNVDNYYQSHHDFIVYHVDRQPGPRILTFFFYLNDVPKGGGTRFTELDVTVTPKKGKAVLWHNCMLNDPLQADFSTSHEAMPVLEGIKYGANAWIHLREFKTSLKEGCI